MSAKHLAKGSVLPPKVEGKLRLYSMEFCPFAQRVRLILLVKGLAHDIVNVHLKNKPDWIFVLHPEGKVPALDTGSQLVIESLDISDFLDERYPEPPLYPKEDENRQRDKKLIKDFDQLIILYYKAMHNEGNLTYADHIQNILPHLQRMESELGQRGAYFGGEQPGMVDFMLWPWAERAPLIKLVYGEIPSKTDFPNIYSWCTGMRSQKAVREIEISTDRHNQIHMQYMVGPAAVDYDSV